MPRQARIALLALGAFVALFLAVITLERVMWRGQPLPGVKLAGVTIEGHDSAELQKAIADEARRLETTPLIATAGSQKLELKPLDFGLDVDEQATYQAVQAAGRDGGVGQWLFGAITRRLDPVNVNWNVRAEDRLLDQGSAQIAKKVNQKPENGGLSFKGGQVREVAPQSGRALDTARLGLIMSAKVTEQARSPFELPMNEVKPDIGQVDVGEAAAKARELLARPIPVSVEGTAVQLEPAELATALRSGVKNGKLQLTINPTALHEALAPKLEGLEQEPRDAAFDIIGGNVRITPGANGRQVNTGQLAHAIMHGVQRPKVGFVTVEPELTTKKAKQLGIEEPISRFTSEYQPGKPRVKNIQRAAEELQNTVILPGEQFSMNGVLGERTKATGYVGAGVIYDGEFKEDVGGGISQMATTLFNAAFFAGLEFDEYKAHSYYISRYPMGREATVSWPNLDLAFTNNTDYGILIRTRATDTAVTVAFYSTDTGAEITATEPEVVEVREPVTEQVTDPEKVSPGRKGYDVVVYRVIKRPGQEPTRERFFTRYDAHPKRVLT